MHPSLSVKSNALCTFAEAMPFFAPLAWGGEERLGSLETGPSALEDEA